MMEKVIALGRYFFLFLGVWAFAWIIRCFFAGQVQEMQELYYRWPGCLVAAVGAVLEEEFKKKEGRTRREIAAFAGVQAVLFGVFGFFCNSFFLAAVCAYPMGKKLWGLWREASAREGGGK